jgi:hypothetical protein
MKIVSTPAEARIRIAVRDKLGETATITRLKHERDVVYLEVVAPRGLKQAEESILEALVGIDRFLEQERVGAVYVNGRSRWIASKP